MTMFPARVETELATTHKSPIRDLVDSSSGQKEHFTTGSFTIGACTSKMANFIGMCREPARNGCHVFTLEARAV